MIPAPFVPLHGTPAVEITLLEYLFRVALYLLAFGGLAAVVFLCQRVVGVVRSAFVDGRGRI